VSNRGWGDKRRKRGKLVENCGVVYFRDWGGGGSSARALIRARGRGREIFSRFLGRVVLEKGRERESICFPSGAGSGSARSMVGRREMVFCCAPIHRVCGRDGDVWGRPRGVFLLWDGDRERGDPRNANSAEGGGRRKREVSFSPRERVGSLRLRTREREIPLPPTRLPARTRRECE
jgi:hypothetical protein